jgi:hypothetical protein
MFVNLTASFIASFVSAWEKRAAWSCSFTRRASNRAAMSRVLPHCFSRDGTILSRSELCDFSFIEGKRDRAFPFLRGL